jgi:hypothetical protein
MGFNFQSHKAVMRDGHAVGYNVNPYITVKIGLHSINVQNGAFWGAGGHQIELEDVPGEILEAIEKWSPEAKASVGLDKAFKRPGAPLKKATS